MNNKRIGGLLNRMAGIIQGPSRQKIELDYLNQAISLTDLERRQREIEHGKFRMF